MRTAEREARLVIVGAGLGGLSAVIEASRRAQNCNLELSITLLDKEARLGGNSAKASSGISAYNPNDPTDLPDYLKDTRTSGGDSGSEQLMATLVENSADALKFLESFGVDLSKVNQLGGHSHSRTHSNPSGPNVGYAIISQLGKHVQGMPSVHLILNARVDHVLMGVDGRATGVQYTLNGLEGAEQSQHEERAYAVVVTIGGCAASDKPLCGAKSPSCLKCAEQSHHEERADAVVITTGGYAASDELLHKYCPTAAEFGTTNGPMATGDGVVFGHEAGARLVDMDKVQVHPTGFVDPANPHAKTKFLAPEKLRGAGGLLFNMAGRRFVDELQRRDTVTQAIIAQPGHQAYIVLSKAGAADFGADAVKFYMAKGLVSLQDSPASLAAHMGVALETLNEELQRYNEGVRAGKDHLGKTVFPGGAVDVSEGAYVATIAPAVHYCMGGLAINSDAQVLNEAGEPIPGLYGAGENAVGHMAADTCVAAGIT
ncbi:hypothetical protein WJX72_003197 [[Myrmecia] bisecta]|uniref:fumarate reductase (NADH) n=1 Tax=[Myrmecia] bisecta TaxID=41462 RepID=A0AAW1PMD6_9CHLO